MKENRRALRREISQMSTREATFYVKSFKLRPEEERAIILCDIKGMSVIEASREMLCSREAVSRRRARGYDRIMRDKDD